MEGLDFRTVVLGGFILFCVCIILVGTLWRQSRGRFCGLGYSFLGFILISLGLGLMFLRGIVGPFFSVVMVNSLMIVGLIFGLIGLETFLGLKNSHRKDFIILTILTSAIAYFTYLNPSTPKRIACFSASMSYFSWRYIRIAILDADRSRKNLTLGIGLVFVVYFIIAVARFITALSLYYDAHSLELPSGGIEIFFGYAQQTLIVLWAYALNLMVNKKLMQELDKERLKFSAVFNGSPHGIVLTKLSDGEIIDANPGLTRMLGLDYKNVLGKTIVKIELCASLEERSKMIRRVLQDGSVRDMEIKFKHSSGRQVVGALSIDQVSVNGEGVLLSTIVDVTEQKDMEQQIAKMAQTDPLTGLLNRAAFSDRLDRAMKKASFKGQKLSLMFLDLDRFKPVNDDFGHAVGDVVLRQTTERITDAVGNDGTVGRIGGDEFVVLVPFGEEQARSIGERIVLAIERPFEIDDRSIRISCSVGIAIYPDHGTDEIELAKNADQAMYAVKKAGGNGVRVFGQTDDTDRIRLEGAWG
ncbi:diguanylate cyclase domain-containing protein [Dethiosulfovibrio salsuginis]|uniref:PAS domain S-box-containing protein/diguanylate cyclase (GGDEF) domain-containing protein n=1 Tax=Dethiosulfovibrio salsuginis TaxID=561720 RepID=A0A1X7L2A8_9BACT|nr:diguanylate cyclase [Dethiosulfovibrio salsuginis]SMG47825.1 PAS domain S-box-containing protein/diguanylate cyclase (GGDEF) domain-containing protein [Dethiosulfovibrio salsuginis]